MTTITDILQRPDIRELRQAVYDAYAERAKKSRQVSQILRYRGDQDRHLPYADDELKQAEEAYFEAQRVYHDAINAACDEAGLPHYIGGTPAMEYEDNGDFWQSLSEAAMWLGLNPATLRQQIHNGSISAEKRGRDWFIRRTEVLRYKRENRGKPGRPAKADNA